MMTAAALAFCASMGVECHSMNDLIETYKAQRPENVIWLAEIASTVQVIPPTPGLPCAGRVIYLGTEPYDIWLCLRDGVPIS